MLIAAALHAGFAMKKARDEHGHFYRKRRFQATALSFGAGA
jgi:hypothetical protein